ncbi:hypothetical protein PV682_23775 [Streptomyces niveiscabiei]|uniref:hypothetical protein n=1 Tax=Streptomyces niveiscabiei TaxID=164115 RepID=UPI0029BAE9FB|nr:hypothetical protein [Streptomyces niveiscabiei]MDX3384460.1 hypothetical protein [Streptomyces niveiscabiei]
MRVLRALARHQRRMWADLARWARRRQTGEGRRLAYIRGQGSMTAAIAFVCVVETIGVAVLLREYPVAHWVVFALDVYTLALVLGSYASCVVRPHVLEADALRVRYGQVDVRLPYDRITGVRRETRFSHPEAEGELSLPVGGQTSVTLELAEPVVHTGLLGRVREVTVVRLHADDADGVVREIRRVRSGRCVSPDPLG